MGNDSWEEAAVRCSFVCARGSGTVRNATFGVIPGRVEDANPESRDSGSGPLDHPGMTEILLLVMAGLVPAIHVFCYQVVDARHRRQVYAVCARQTATAGHDEVRTPFLQVAKMNQAPDGRLFSCPQ